MNQSTYYNRSLTGKQWHKPQMLNNHHPVLEMCQTANYYVVFCFVLFFQGECIYDSGTGRFNPCNCRYWRGVKVCKNHGIDCEIVELILATGAKYFLIKELLHEYSRDYGVNVTVDENKCHIGLFTAKAADHLIEYILAENLKLQREKIPPSQLKTTLEYKIVGEYYKGESSLFKYQCT